jgi:hypothetical protein
LWDIGFVSASRASTVSLGPKIEVWQVILELS